jgi:hypothetical protein
LFLQEQIKHIIIIAPGRLCTHGVGMKLASLTASSDAAQAPMILGSTPPEGYLYICMNQRLAIWGHPDIVQASMTDAAGEPRACIGDAAPL